MYWAENAPPNDTHVLMPETCYVTIYSKEGVFADVIKLRDTG